MPEEIVFYVTSYGYLAIFILVFLQESGMPNPLPNEILLTFSGYMCYSGHLILPLVITTAVLADLAGTNFLYFVFYFAGSFILRIKPRWIPLSENTLANMKGKIINGGRSTIFIFRCTPFTRGYVSVICGLLRVPVQVYLPLAFLSASAWASFYVITGYFLGPSWALFSEHLGKNQYAIIIILSIVILLVILLRYFSRQKSSNPKQSLNVQLIKSTEN